ncbi:MAG TPA: sulfite exporter TauE/SafE family protein [Povalibacter sp.]
MQWLLGILGGASVGLILGLVGGGGSILAMPLMIHVLGVHSAHIAIGTAAVAVSANALAQLALNTRRGVVKWRCAAVFAASGVFGATAGAALGKRVDAQHLLILFGLLMIGVGIAMLRPRAAAGNSDVRLDMQSAVRLAPPLILLGFGAGAASGFFGIGGGFLIVPGLILATRMPLLAAISSSLVAVAAFGLTTAASYAWSGLVDWRLAGIFILGGIAGAVLGSRIAVHLAGHKTALARVFAVLVIAVGAYVIASSR